MHRPKYEMVFSDDKFESLRKYKKESKQLTLVFVHYWAFNSSTLPGRGITTGVHVHNFLT